MKNKQEKEPSAFEKLVKQKVESRQKRESKKADILKTMEQQVRKNKISDKRWGQNNPNISADKKMLMRFTKERMKVRKAKRFDLDDDHDDKIVGLTHMGKSIDEIDDFKEAIEKSDDEYDNEVEKRESLHYAISYNRS